MRLKVFEKFLDWFLSYIEMLNLMNGREDPTMNFRTYFNALLQSNKFQ